MIWVLVPVISVLVVGLVLVTWIYFRAKEKQIMIEKGMSYSEMADFLKTKRDKFVLLKLGIIIFFFGLGLGSGMMLHVTTGYDEWIAFMIFVFTGAGFIIAHFVARKEEAKITNGNGNK